MWAYASASSGLRQRQHPPDPDAERDGDGQHSDGDEGIRDEPSPADRRDCRPRRGREQHPRSDIVQRGGKGFQDAVDSISPKRRTPADLSYGRLRVSRIGGRGWAALSVR